jgi:hypothetical protein
MKRRTLLQLIGLAPVAVAAKAVAAPEQGARIGEAGPEAILPRSLVDRMRPVTITHLRRPRLGDPPDSVWCYQVGGVGVIAIRDSDGMIHEMKWVR